MNEKVKVSVIMPSFNVAAYINQCMDSVINQSLQDIEIICVDAGSTDGTLDILRRYEKKDRRIKVIISDKKSYGYQMNLGVNAAHGKYIGIVETDDFILTQMYEELYQIAEENNVDFVKSDFYRFWENDGKLDKLLYGVIGNNSFYNRVVNTEEEKRCFPSIASNTWCGIYNRKFLLDNHICHNESPGASFQDNGFYFLVLAYAKRGYFVNKAYYMNRRDNPDSSIFNKRKSFCICEEYEFIENNLKKDEKIYHANKFIFAYMCYRAHYFNIRRVPDENMQKYMQRFSDTLSRLDRQGLLKRDVFRGTDWDDARRIIENPMQYYYTEILPQREIFNKIREYDSVIIYGADKTGQKAFHILFNNMLREKVYCFAVTHMENNISSYAGVPVYDIHELLEYRDKSAVVTAASERHHEEIFIALKELGFFNVFIVSE
ncbi:MAG: glycosyltransferase [Ruminococcus flavefaciens]|nr:glycosyltransferase [Ruminococcus flavefaciens]